MGFTSKLLSLALLKLLLSEANQSGVAHLEIKLSTSQDYKPKRRKTDA
jgi:hypothetical protein